MDFESRPNGPFNLLNQTRYFGDWITDTAGVVHLPFPVEGWRGAAVVSLRQLDDGRVVGTVAGEEPERAWQQALATLSLDVDGSEFPAVGDRDAIIGHLLSRYECIRPVLFHSPYEAAVNFVIGQRISVEQARRLRQRLADDAGDRVAADGSTFAAFPRPQQLLELTTVPGLAQEKLDRLHGIARAALDGKLDRAYLRGLPVDQALAELRTLRGVGEFSAQGILMRGAGLVDALTQDELTPQAVQQAYGLTSLPSQAAVARLAEEWQPFRLWCQVLLHVWLRRADAGSARTPAAGTHHSSVGHR
jgi:DNA-3-methyladenine glycosylase II